MSSFVRRIERQQHESRRLTKNLVTGEMEPGPARRKFYGGRGSKLGVSNPRDKALIARLARDRKWGRNQ